ncbi:hypothetical protein M885DRAFT_570762 [Pelagophyceae sp. CCMP2097]|nr:hypothetical protein M885DRAFT_570762 [Pelagophyceae sp. CCMP2097]
MSTVALDNVVASSLKVVDEFMPAPLGSNASVSAKKAHALHVEEQQIAVSATEVAHQMRRVVVAAASPEVAEAAAILHAQTTLGTSQRLEDALDLLAGPSNRPSHESDAVMLRFMVTASIDIQIQQQALMAQVMSRAGPGPAPAPAPVPAPQFRSSTMYAWIKSLSDALLFEDPLHMGEDVHTFLRAFMAKWISLDVGGESTEQKKAAWRAMIPADIEVVKGYIKTCKDRQVASLTELCFQYGTTSSKNLKFLHEGPKADDGIFDKLPSGTDLEAVRAWLESHRQHYIACALLLQNPGQNRARQANENGGDSEAPPDEQMHAISIAIKFATMVLVWMHKVHDNKSAISTAATQAVAVHLATEHVDALNFGTAEWHARNVLYLNVRKVSANATVWALYYLSCKLGLYGPGDLFVKLAPGGKERPRIREIAMDLYLAGTDQRQGRDEGKFECVVAVAGLDGDPRSKEALLLREIGEEDETGASTRDQNLTLPRLFGPKPVRRFAEPIDLG